MAAFASDITEADFERVVIEGSKQVPVLVDFWAPWCGPCRALTPVLEKLAEAYAGKFVLVKINSDENPELAQQFNIRSIPNVKAFVDGAFADEFLGALPESAVRAFIDRLLPTPGDLKRREAAEKAEQGDMEGALGLLNEASALEPRNDRVHADQLALLLELGRIEDAQQTASRLSPLAAQDPQVSRLLARLQFADAAGADADSPALQAQVQAHPDDLAARLRLAKLLAVEQQFEPALEELLEIVRRDRKFGDDVGRKTMLAVFELMGADHPSTPKYRRLLASALN